MAKIPPTISRISDDYSVAPQIAVTEVADIAAAGFATIICNRPDNEDPGQPSAQDISRACVEAGIDFHHIPVTGMLAGESVTRQRQVIDNSSGPVLAYCRSGQRSFLIWKASA